MKIATFSDLENILRLAVKMCDISACEIASANGFTASGFSGFMTKRNHISIQKGDKLIEYFLQNHKEILEIAYKNILSVNVGEKA